ncbi:MAG TPA: DUF58 domain-containing protein [Fervidobacterium sp.]|nr:DUF58 domain-containing protein [Fervidobacterium sp.]
MRRVWMKVNPIVYVFFGALLFSNFFVYNKYIWLLDVLGVMFIFHCVKLHTVARNVVVNVTARARVFSNEPFELKIEIVSKNSSVLSIEVIPPLVVKNSSQFLTLEPYKSYVVTFTTAFGTRGNKKLGAYSVKIRSVTNLFDVIITEDIKSDVRVLPNLEETNAMVERILEMLPILKSKYRFAEDVSYIRNIREYENEPMNRIHWKQSARTDKLMVKEYEYSGTAKTYILLDLNLPAGIYSKEAWRYIHRKYQEDAIKATAGLLRYFSERHEKTNLFISHSRGAYSLALSDYVLYFDYLAEVEGEINNESTTSELLGEIIENVQPIDTVLVTSMFLTKEEVEQLLKLRSRCGRVVVLLMPYGFRESKTKKFKSYFDVPVEVREFYKFARVLEEENILVQIWYENTSFMEGILGIAEKDYI